MNQAEESIPDSSVYPDELSFSAHDSFSHIWDENHFDHQSEEEPGFDYEFESTSHTVSIVERFKQFLEEWTNQLISMKLNNKDLTKIYQLTTSLIEQFSNINNELIDDVENSIAPKRITGMLKELVLSEFSLYNTAYKVNKTIIGNDFYVDPEERAIGTRFEQRRDKKTGHIFPQLIQSIAFYVPIVQTIKSLFNNPDFNKLYFEYNSVKHICASNELKSFRCGTVCRNNDLFGNDQFALQIQLSTDDFELNNPLQSKAGVHKTCAVYFSIRNMPKEYLSRINNIYLVCLCNSNDLKTDYINFNDIWQMVRDDISVLENIGVKIGEHILKGSLVWLSADILGANTSLGFSEGFNCSYYCRFCESHIDECAVMTTENSAKNRTIPNYNVHLRTAESLRNIDYKKSCGIKRCCKLNELKYFHMLTNISVDILHDNYEGAMLFAMKGLFHAIIELKLLKLDQIIDMVYSFDYGESNQRNIPSTLQIERSNLGQNGSQIYCLFRHLPFIFHRLRLNEKFRAIWDVISSMLRISRFLHSLNLTTDQLPILKNEITNHLDLYQKHFKKKLKPKQHNLVHYPRVIEAMGPVFPMNMLRSESKHKAFKDIRHNTLNFINIHKTLAIRHQQIAAFQGFSYKDEIKCGSKSDFDKNEWDFFGKLFDDGFKTDSNKVKQIKYFIFNHFKYKCGYLIVHNKNLFEIEKIVEIGGDFLFVSRLLSIVKFDEFFHSYEVVACGETHCFHLLRFDELSNKKPYEKKKIKDRCYIMADNFDVSFET